MMKVEQPSPPPPRPMRNEERAHHAVVSALLTLSTVLLICGEIARHFVHYGNIAFGTIYATTNYLSFIFPNVILGYCYLFLGDTGIATVLIMAMPLLLLSWQTGRLLMKGAARWGWGWMVIAYGLTCAAAYGGFGFILTTFACTWTPMLCQPAPGP